MENDKKQKGRVLAGSIVLLFVFLCDFYIILNFPKDYMMIGIAALVTLACGIVTISSWLKWKEMEHLIREEQYKDLMKAQKSSYLIFQQKFQDLDNKLNFIGQKIMPLEKVGEVNQRKIAAMLDNLMEDQKKIAKITISRSKENADALMNSNDDLLHKMSEFQNSTTEMETQLLSRQEENFQQQIQKLEYNQAELMGKILEFADLLKKDVEEMSENVNYISHTAAEKISVLEETYHPEKESSVTEETGIPEIASETIVEAVPESIPEPVVEESIPEPVSESVVEEIASAEPIPEAVPETVMENPNKMMTPEDIAALLASTEVSEPVVEEPISVSEPVPESVVEEIAAAEPIPEVIPEPIPEAVAEVIPEPAAAEPMAAPAPKKPEPNDPNKMMSPEDIAALIANTTAEELPETTPKIVEEEKPPMPDISDPNKVMSPEDIAALIANM